jgi:hypothetical protein
VTCQLGLELYSRTRVCICLSISLGWSPSDQFTKQPNLSKQTYLDKSRKIDQGEVEHIRAVHLQVDRQPGHALVLARDTEHHLFDLAPGLGEVDKPFFEVEELAPLAATRRVDQLGDKRAVRTIPWPRGRKSRPTMLGKA